jgi:hypothetical protein
MIPLQLILIVQDFGLERTLFHAFSFESLVYFPYRRFDPLAHLWKNLEQTQLDDHVTITPWRFIIQSGTGIIILQMSVEEVCPIDLCAICSFFGEG